MIDLNSIQVGAEVEHRRDLRGMRLLLFAGTLPMRGRPYAGLFNARCASLLAEKCEIVRAVVPRPFVPPLLGHVEKYRVYSEMTAAEVRKGVVIHRPLLPVVPGLGASLVRGTAGYFSNYRTVVRLHKQFNFDAILSFDLVESGGWAWRFGRKLGLPAAGWAFGNDVKYPRGSALGRLVAETTRKLDLVFYQSAELRTLALQGAFDPRESYPADQHIVLPHGIVEPPDPVPDSAERQAFRSEIGVSPDQRLLLSVGRIHPKKGAFDLLKAVREVNRSNVEWVCCFVGAEPGEVHAERLREAVVRDPILRNCVRVMPAVEPEAVWRILFAGDAFAIPSHSEGMPNSLLEAMAAGLPCVAYDIPPVREINGLNGSPVVMTSPVGDTDQFAGCLMRLAREKGLRKKLADHGKLIVSERFLATRNLDRALSRLATLVTSS